MEETTTITTTTTSVTKLKRDDETKVMGRVVNLSES
jgi:hypothetical protein